MCGENIFIVYCDINEFDKELVEQAINGQTFETQNDVYEKLAEISGWERAEDCTLDDDMGCSVRISNLSQFTCDINDENYPTAEWVAYCEIKA